MKEPTWLDKVKLFIRQLFCRHEWRLDEWDYWYTLTCSKCHKANHIEKGHML